MNPFLPQKPKNMISPISLQGGLSGAIGSAIDTFQQRLYFVEFDGKISRLDLLPQNATMLLLFTTFPFFVLEMVMMPMVMGITMNRELTNHALALMDLLGSTALLAP